MIIIIIKCLIYSKYSVDINIHLFSFVKNILKAAWFVGFNVSLGTETRQAMFTTGRLSCLPLCAK